jgi:hypothetical protein
MQYIGYSSAQGTKRICVEVKYFGKERRVPQSWE